MEIAFGILGRTALHLHGRLTVQWGRPKEHAVLAALLAQPNSLVSADTLLDWVWIEEEQEPRNPASTFRTYAARIRTTLREAGLPADLRTVDGSFVLETEEDRIDWFAFRRMVGEARLLGADHRHEEAGELIEEALLLWRDQPLRDLRTPRANRVRIAAVREDWLPANNLLLTQWSASGRHREVLQRLDDLQRQHRADLGLAKQRLQTLHLLGDTDQRDQYYFDARRLFRASKEEDAATELKRVQDELIRAGDITAAPATIPLPREGGEAVPDAESTGRSLLPVDVDDFVGHDDLLHTLDELAQAADGRFRPGVIVLDGLAGIGKTALAVHWAHRQVGHLADHAVYIDLHGYDADRRREPEEMVDDLLSALGGRIDRYAGQLRRAARLRELLGGRRTVVVLDNVAKSAHVQPLLLTLAPCLVIVTSRQALPGLVKQRGARHRSVTPLSVEHSAELLTNRIGARAAAQRETVAQLAQLCDGFPMTLQLAAHHIELHRELALHHFADELRDRSRLLDMGDAGDDPPTSMRATLFVTYEHLHADAQRLFRLLGLPPTPTFSLTAAAALAGLSSRAAHRCLDALVSAHFVDHTGEPNRYRMHDLLHVFAHELATDEVPAQEAEAAERRLLSFYLHSSFAADHTVFPFYPMVPMLPLESGVTPVEIESEKAGVTWLLRERRTMMLLVGWAARRHPEYAWRYPHVLYAIFRRYGYLGHLKKPYEVAIAACAALGDLESEGASRNDLGRILMRSGDQDGAQRQFDLALALARQTGSPMGITISLMQQGDVELDRGSPEEAVVHYEQALEKAREIGAIGPEAAIMHGSAMAHRRMAHTEEALELFGLALEIRARQKNRHGEAQTLAELAAALNGCGRYHEARDRGERALAVVEGIHDLEVAPRACAVLAKVHYNLEQYDKAVGYARQAARLSARSHNVATEADAFHILGHALQASRRPAAAIEGWRLSVAAYLDLGDLYHTRHVLVDLAAAREEPAIPGR